MNLPPDLPALGNEAAPSYNKKIDKALRELGDFDGLPWFRILWGQSPDSTRFWGGARYFKYRDHLERDLAWGVPKYDLAGQSDGYSAVYKRNDIIPAGVILDQIVSYTDIGTPRFFIEIATYYSPDEWERERYKDEHGQIVWENGEPKDFLGEYPRGGIDYELLWLCADHDDCCEDVSPNNNVGRREDKRCFGFRRLPTMSDVQNIASRVAYFKSKKKEISEKGEVDAEKKNAEYAAQVDAYWEKFESQVAEDNYQMWTPYSKRLTSEGSGKDLFKYTDMAPAIEKHEKEHGPLIVEK